MEHRITIAHPADDVFAFLADPAHIRHWLPHLRRSTETIPRDGLELDREALTVRFAFAPGGTWRIEPGDRVATLVLVLEIEDHTALAALQSIKSHVEAVAGGDPTLPMPDAASRLYGHSATQEPEI